MADSYVIEVREGTGEPVQIELRLGVERPPLSVGSEGGWRVRAPGVLGIHVYIYFDGRALFAQSADPTKPAVANGRAVGTTWASLSAPATIALGTAKLVFRRMEEASDDEDDRTTAQGVPFHATLPEDDRTVAEAPVVRTVAPVRPFPPGAFSSRADESTRFAPIGDDNPDSDATRVVPLTEPGAGFDAAAAGGPGARAGGRPAALVRPAAGVPWNASGVAPGTNGPNGPPLMMRPTDPNLLRAQDDGEGGLNTTVFQPAQLPTDPPRAGLSGPFPRAPGPDASSALRAAPAPGKRESRLGREWRAAPTTRKILYLLLPPALGGAFWVIFANDPQPVRRPRPRPSATASAEASPPPAGSATATPPSSSTAQAEPPPTTPSPPPATPPTNSPTTRTPPVATSTSTAGTPDGGDRRERTAADDVATGQYEAAAQIYDSLALDHPENPAFGEAARILRQKLDAGLR